MLIWRRARRTATLWRVDESVPRQPFTPRRRAALTLAYLAHFRCARGHESEHYVHPHYGLCTTCLDADGLLEMVASAANSRLG